MKELDTKLNEILLAVDKGYIKIAIKQQLLELIDEIEEEAFRRGQKSAQPA